MNSNQKIVGILSFESFSKELCVIAESIRNDLSFVPIFSKDQLQLLFKEKQFELLVELCSNPGKVFKREFLYKKIWGGELFTGNRTLDVHIRALRSTLPNDYIKTIKGVGYKVS